MLWETVRLATQAITRNMLRSFLTVLGIVIGVAAVIAMVTVGQGSSAQVKADVASLGTNVLIVRPGQRQMGPGSTNSAQSFRIQDTEAIRELSVADEAASSKSTSMTVVYGNTNASTTVNGTDNAYLDINNWELARGRTFTESEERSGSAVCIIGETVRQTLFGNMDPTGETIRLKTLSCDVIGLLKAKGASTFGQDQDDIVLIPIQTLQRRIEGNTDVSTIFVALEKDVSSARGIRDVTALMRERRHIGPDDEDDFSVMDTAQLSAILTGINGVLTGLLSSVAAVSLLVGGIGIMNIMLVSVTERTREIGIRLAVGAQAGQVLTQFLVEAIVLSVIGGILGILLGLGLAAIASRFMNIPFSPDPLVVVAAFLFSGFVGVVFGFFPARAAAQLDPIDALRHQ